MISLSIVLGVAAAIVGVVIGALLASKSLESNIYGYSNAVDLLKEEKIEEWNAFRDLNPNWTPNLAGVDLQQLDLQVANLNGLTIDQVNFSASDLSFTNFGGASIKNCTFNTARLYGAVFDQATISRCDFTNAELNKVSLDEAAFDEPKLTQIEPDEFVNIAEFVRIFRQDTEALNRLNGKQLKQLIVFLLRRSMFTLHEYAENEEVGPDILASRLKLDKKLEYLADCKYYPTNKAIGAITVEAFAAQKKRMHVDVALLITNSSFTESAQTIAQHEGIKLIDRKLLLIWILTIQTPDHFLDILDSL